MTAASAMGGETRVFARDRTNAVISACLSPPFVATGVWIVLDGTIAGAVIGLAAIAFFGFVLIQAVRALFDRRPGVVVGPEGLSWSLAGHPTVTVPWDEMESISMIRGLGRRFVAIKVRDPKTYSRLGGWLDRLASGLSDEPAGGAVQFPAGLVRVGPDELLATLQGYLKQYGGPA